MIQNRHANSLREITIYIIPLHGKMISVNRNCYVEECIITDWWFEHGSLANKHKCWHSLCYWSSRDKKWWIYKWLKQRSDKWRAERMHYSLGVAGLGHISVGRVGRFTDLVGCVLVPVAVGWGRLTWIPGSQHSCWVCQDRYLRASVGLPLLQALSSLDGLV